jgi:hypothetical protein
MDAEKAPEIVEVPISHEGVEQLEHDEEYDVQVSTPSLYLFSLNSHSSRPFPISPSYPSEPHRSPSGLLLPFTPIVPLTPN